MIYILLDAWGNPYTAGELTPENKKQIIDGSLACIRVDANIDPKLITICSVELEYEEDFDKEESWEQIEPVQNMLDEEE